MYNNNKYKTNHYNVLKKNQKAKNRNPKLEFTY